MHVNRKQTGLSDYALETIRCRARQLIGKAGFTESDIDDIEQELTLDLLQRLPKFNPRKATQSTFVARLINRKVSNLIRHREREMRDRRREACSLDDLVLDPDGETVPRGCTMDQDEVEIRAGRRRRTCAELRDLRLDVASVVARLPRDLRELARLLMTESLRNAARSLGVSRWTIFKSKDRIREAFEESGLGDYLQKVRTTSKCTG